MQSLSGVPMLLHFFQYFCNTISKAGMIFAIRTADFQLNEMLLQLSEERFSDKKIGKIEVYRIEDGSTVTFDNVFSENGVKKSIRCSNILIRIMRNEE